MPTKVFPILQVAFLLNLMPDRFGVIHRVVLRVLLLLVQRGRIGHMSDLLNPTQSLRVLEVLLLATVSMVVSLEGFYSLSQLLIIRP